MTQTDAKFIAELRALAEKATRDVEAYGASAPLLKFANVARTAIPRFIKMVDRLKQERDEARAGRHLVSKGAMDLGAEHCFVVAERDAALSRAEQAEALHAGLRKHYETAVAERDALRVNAVDDAFVKRVMEMPDAELLASVEPGEIDLNKQLFKTAKMQVERDTALAEAERLTKALEPFASTAHFYDPVENDDEDLAWSTNFTLGQLRRARAALAPKE